jgi:NADPH:quinone reductase-like Zn-dependent oxidoreductase
MKALLSRQPGGPETLVLDAVPEPAAGPGEVQISVRACGVNYPDLLIIQDLYQYKPPSPFIPGGVGLAAVELGKAIGARVVAAASSAEKLALALYREGRIKPAVTERFSLQRAGEAIGRLGTRDVRGKVVMMIE